VWADEFNGSGAPSSANWNYHVGNGLNQGQFGGWGNGEWEWYRPENCTQTGGNLRIQATWLSSPMVIAGRNWYQRSCRITTQGKRSWRYGRIEARISAPSAAGSWPAFWMMGDTSGGTYTGTYNPPFDYHDQMATTWPSCGEIDIFESLNYQNVAINNIFWDSRTGVYPWTAGYIAYHEPNPWPSVSDKTAFHIYAIEWDAQYIRWFVDGRQTHVIDIRPGDLEEFHKNHYIIMNLALAGTLPNKDGANAVPQQSQFPLNMLVDYVRVYQR
jgi:beta-glucanase (GH16 family)